MSLPPRKTLEQRRAEIAALPASVRPRTKPPLPSRIIRPIDLITLGADDKKRAITIDDGPRMEHLHAIGATGCGKSTFFLSGILQDIRRGRGVCVLDPHGGHPDSLINTVLRYLHDHQWLATGRVHIIAPNIREHVVGLNPLGPLPGTDPTVIAGALLKAFQRATGEEGTIDQPKTTRRVLGTLFTALAELRMTLPEALDLIDYQDQRGVRRDVIARLTDEIARKTLERIERLARAPRGQEAFEREVLGPDNRLTEFLKFPAMRAMFGMNHEAGDKTIDLLDIMNRGHILLIDLQHGTQIDEDGADLLGRIILRYLFMLMAHRRPYQLDGEDPKYHPFFVYVDECHRYLTDDIGSLLVEARKFGIGVALAHQFLAQLGKPGEKIYEAVRNSTEIKAVFRVKSPEEAQALAHDVVKLDLEMPVDASIRPVQVGFEFGELKGSTYAVHEGEGEAVATHAARAIAEGVTEMQNWMKSASRGHSATAGSGNNLTTSIGDAQGLSSAVAHVEGMNLTYDPQTQSMILTPQPLGMSLSVADSAASANIATATHNETRGTNSFGAETESEMATEGAGGGLAKSRIVTDTNGTSQSQQKNRGTMRGSSANQALFPVFKPLPTSFHSLPNVLYMAGETIRELPIGRAILRFRNNVTFLNVPPPCK